MVPRLPNVTLGKLGDLVRKKRRDGLSNEGEGTRKRGERRKRLDTFLPSCRTELVMSRGWPGVRRGYF